MNVRVIFILVAAMVSAGTVRGEKVSPLSASRLVRPVSEAPIDLASALVFRGTEAGREANRVDLPGGSRRLEPGISPVLRSQRIDAEHPMLAMIGLGKIPSKAEWALWSEQGVEYIKPVGRMSWLVRLTRGADWVAGQTEAMSLAEFRASDKIDKRLATPAPAFFDATRNLVVVALTLVPAVAPDAAARIRREFHHSGLEFLDEPWGARFITIVTSPASVHEIAWDPDVLAIAPGAWKSEVLMDGVRATARAENVVGAQGKILTGLGIRAATNEWLIADPSGATSNTEHLHEGFWNHDLSGNRTTPRLTSFALSRPLGCGRLSHIPHGMMTGGVLLGNGWGGDPYGGENLGFRGIARRATWECYWETGARAHVSSHSYVAAGQFNAAVVGHAGGERHHPQVMSLGNNGLRPIHTPVTPPGEPNKVGYYSVLNAYKNVLGVANAQVDGEIFAGSSAGPTVDGRLKPDISAPTGNTNGELLGRRGGFTVDVYRIELVRTNGNNIVWRFLNGTAEGWGATGLGSPNVVVTTHHGRIQVDVANEPWGTGWQGRPAVGTQTLPHPSMGALDILGHQDDVLRVTYRASSLGYFDFQPIWFRDHPYIDPNCPSNDPSIPSLCAWDSQSKAGGIGIGDGQIRTMEIPIGLAGDNQIGPNPHGHREDLTWADQPVEFLGLQFKTRHKQPTPGYPHHYDQSSGGTSGASPVLSGAYALALENLRRLSPQTDLDAKTQPSIYFQPAGPQFSYGPPLNSTWKALFVHTANDMVRENPGNDVPKDPDTLRPAIYHRGPDYKTGYGMVDIQDAVDLMLRDSAQETLIEMLEAEIEDNTFDTYTLSVSGPFASGPRGIKVTLVWDDSPVDTKLVNEIDLVLEAPDGTLFYPWSLAVPVPPVEHSDIVPARRDQPNRRDNIEQVLVDDVDPAHGGDWKIHVVANGFLDPLFQQRYSVVVSPWDTDAQCHSCDAN